MGTKPHSKKKTILLSVLIPIGLILAIILGYFLYLILSYHRVGDQPSLEIENPKTAAPAASTEYKLLSYNIGFCAYTPDFGFFMDGGKGSRAKSADAVNEVLEESEAQPPDDQMHIEVRDMVQIRNVKHKFHRDGFPIFAVWDRIGFRNLEHIAGIG